MELAHICVYRAHMWLECMWAVSGLGLGSGGVLGGG